MQCRITCAKPVFQHYPNFSALVAFAGIDPTVRQSGEFNSTHNHMSKRGSPYLRHAIFLAATTCSFHNSPLNAYYKKKRDQGKHHLTATGSRGKKAYHRNLRRVTG